MTTQTDDTFSLPKMELDILDFWNEENIFNQTLIQTSECQPYIFYDGPPFATGLPHHGHLLASTLKDIIPRYYTMCGYYVVRRFGWDCHGLPIEHEINKSLNMPADEAYQKLGLAGYNQACRDIVMRYRDAWKSTIQRLGRWVDFENDYKTMDKDFMESVWWVFQQLWKKDLVYQGTKVMPFSTALQTPIANFEAGSNYQDTQDPAIYTIIKAPNLEGDLVIWTTTPWTLPANLAVCVAPNISYALVKIHGFERPMYFAEDRVESCLKDFEYSIIKTVSGAELVGCSYEPIFPYFADLQNEGGFCILAGDFITLDQGTGLVHAAPAFGEDDHRICQENNIKALPCPITDSGHFTEIAGSFSGIYVKDADTPIIQHLKSQNVILKHETIVHAYPMCPRSDTPLLYRAVPAWYVEVTKIKDKMLANNLKTNWVPEHIKEGRFGQWLANAKDWAISRNRVWGTPIPVWINDTTGSTHCIGSASELESLCQTQLTDLHREHIDHLTFTKPNEPGTYRRIDDVLDCWFESGSMPVAQLHYPFEQKNLFAKGFPAKFIAEGVDQTRGWFYSLMVLSSAIFDQPPFENVIVNGIVLAKDGKKMSKRLKNYTAPDTLMSEYGADALRLYLINSGLVKAEEQRFDDAGVKDMVRKTLLPWYHAFKFLQTYAKADQWSKPIELTPTTNTLDAWVISRLESLKAQLHQQMSAYKLYNIVPELLAFLDELTNVYIRLNRDRFWKEEMDNDKKSAYETLHHVLMAYTQCMAPFTPFLAEFIFKQLTEFDQTNHPQSVHLTRFPSVNESLRQPYLEEAVSQLEEVLEMVRQLRAKHRIKTKIPLSELTLIHTNQVILDNLKTLEPYIQAASNVKQVLYKTNEPDFVTLKAMPNAPVLGKRLGKLYGQYRNKINQLSNSQLHELEDQKTLTIDEESFNLEDILVKRVAINDQQTMCSSSIAINLNTSLDQNLINEGLAREVVNRIQKLRKNLNLNVSDRIDIEIHTTPELEVVIKHHAQYIKHETLTRHLNLVDKPHPNGISDNIEDALFHLSIQVNNKKKTTT
ncbi:MAG: isoleucine--tRNA ligase [Candidatus Comchoanobacterales bacterium]